MLLIKFQEYFEKMYSCSGPLVKLGIDHALCEKTAAIDR